MSPQNRDNHNSAPGSHCITVVLVRIGFHGALRTRGALFTSRGATVKGQWGFHRNRPAQGADEFVRSVLEQPIASLN
jgi:hypothetical protein